MSSVVPHIIGQTPLRPSPLFDPLCPPLYPPLAALRSPAFFSDALAGVLFENHWLWWLAAAGVGVAFYFIGNSRADKRLVHAGIAALALTVAWVLLALLVASPGERLYAAHKGLADAASRHDVNAMLTFIAADFRAPGVGITGEVPTKERIEHYLKTYGIKETYITVFKFTRGTSTAATDVTLVTQTAMSPIKTSWRLSWDDLPNEDWKIVRADLTRLGDQPISRNEVIP